MKTLMSHFRRIMIEIFNFLFDHDFILKLIGLVNKKVKLINSVFLVYPANEEYALSYVYSYRLPKVIWGPWLCGLLLQNGKLGLMFCISATNNHFTDPENTERLKGVAKRMEELRLMLGAQRKTFAGILPGVLHLKRIIRETPEADLTAEMVLMAIEQTKNRESLLNNNPIIILGGEGFIGRRVLKLLKKKNNTNVYSVDVKNNKCWPSDLPKERAMVVNITSNGALREYLDLISSEAVVLNEAYPEPTDDTLKILRSKDCNCYHVAGVDAFALPLFPAVYRGSIPCCAAWPSSKIKIIVKRIN